MPRGRKKQNGQGPPSGRRERHGYGQGLDNHFVKHKNQAHGDDKRSNASNITSFSLRDEARNTERHHDWTSGQKLRHSHVNFVSAGSAEPEASMKLQSNPPNAASEPIPHSSPLQAPLASMSIKDQNTAYSDALPSDQRRGEVTAANDLIPPTSGMERGQDGSAGGLFFLDDVGSSLPSRNKLSPPQVPRRRPSSLSDSSEEVIVFEGRRHARVDNLGGRKPTAQKPSTNNPGDSHSPQANGRLNRGVVDTVQSPSTRLAIHYEPQQSGRSIYNTLDSTYPKTDFNKQAKGQPTERIGLSRSSRRRNQRRSKGKTFLAAEEDEILADYIEHMNDEEDHDITLGNVANPEGLIQDLLADLGSPADTDSDAEEVAAGSPPTGNLRRDSYVAQSTDDDDDDDDNFDFDASTDEESDESIDEALIAADVQEYMDDIEDERDLLERKQARMTDEQIARLLSKQEEFGIDSSQLLLFDGDDPNVSSEEDDDAMVFRSAAAKRRRRAKRKAQNNPTGASFAAMELTNIFDQDPYGDFDVMDHNRPSLKRTPKSRRSAPAFELSDVELQASLQLAWEKDRSKKKIKKKEREELRAQGLLGRDNGHADLKMKYREGISFGEIKNELVEFFVSERQSLVLPPMGNHERRSIHEVAHVLRLKSQSRGQGKDRFPVLYKTGRTGDFDELAINRVVESMFSSKRFFPRKGGLKGQKPATGPRPGGRRTTAGNTSGVTYQDGEIVGAAAPEIGADNRGRAMLEKMGWSKGTALGALNNKGMLQPVVHTVKISKAGLG